LFIVTTLACAENVNSFGAKQATCF